MTVDPGLCFLRERPSSALTRLSTTVPKAVVSLSLDSAGGRNVKAVNL